MKLYVTGTSNPYPTRWSIWDEVSLVLAEDSKQALELSGDSLCAEVNTSIACVLIRSGEPNWGDDI